jgi:hypothetical protein
MHLSVAGSARRAQMHGRIASPGYMILLPDGFACS